MAMNLQPAVSERFSATTSASDRFFTENAGRLADACLAMARRFVQGGRLLALGTGSAATDAQHVAVEFVHPVIAGKRALPALALDDRFFGPSASSQSGDAGRGFAPSLRLLSQPSDIALGISNGIEDSILAEELAHARQLGLLTIGLGVEGSAVSDMACIDFAFVVPSADPLVVQEVHETAYHILWELVHVFFGHLRLSGATEGNSLASRSDAATFEHFLYPYLEEREEADLQGVLDEVRASTSAKARDITALRREVLTCHAGDLIAAAETLARAFAAGRTLFAFGNGGSATDAADLVYDLMHPLLPGWRTLPALSLTQDVATLTAIGNDVGFENVFARPLMAFAGPGDAAVGISTSGNSPNIVAALERAKQRGLVTLALTGYDGGQCARMAGEGLIDYLFVVSSEHIPRIQEAQATIYHSLTDLVQRFLAGVAR